MRAWVHRVSSQEDTASATVSTDIPRWAVPGVHGGRGSRACTRLPVCHAGMTPQPSSLLETHVLTGSGVPAPHLPAVRLLPQASWLLTESRSAKGLREEAHEGISAHWREGPPLWSFVTDKTTGPHGASIPAPAAYPLGLPRRGGGRLGESGGGASEKVLRGTRHRAWGFRGAGGSPGMQGVW